MPKTTIVYIDGFNFYYGAVRGTPHRWLDLQKYCTRLLKDDNVVAVNYFTSPVSGEMGVRQAQFLGALTTRPLVKIVFGKYRDREIPCRHSSCAHDGPRLFTRPEEKQTDVAIAVTMLDDAFHDRCEKQILISGDSDLVPAVSLLRAQFRSMKLLVYNPTPDTTLKGRRASELIQAAGNGRALPTALFASCHLPDSVTDAHGNIFTKPSMW